jgi:translation initiation factor IF-2
MTNKTTKPQETEQAAEADGGRQPTAPQTRVAAPSLEIPPALSVHDLASLMGVDPIEVIKQLMRNGHMFSINDVLEHETASVVASAFGFQPKESPKEEQESSSRVISSDKEDPEQLETRPPVVTILGHVDHGKTTLLDAIRNSNIVGGEVGGITQHIGAYQVESGDNEITFLDTPGHEAFTAMRARGAQVTDIAVLVVAADDGIMPQTVEAIDHAKAAGVPIVVAINKIDRPGADAERVKRQLSEHDLLIEEWGGDVIAVPMSALKGEGVSELLDNILLVAEVGALKANPTRMAQGVVVEARIDKSKGAVATVLVQTGTLRVGDNVVAGAVRGRVKAMINDRGKRIRQAGPSVPVEILGLGGLPQPGDTLVVSADERAAKDMIEARERESRSQQGRGAGVSLEEIYSRLESGDVKALNLIVKTDVQGSIDAVRSVLEGLSTDQTKVNLIHVASGTITENDVLLAVASGAIIVGFNSRTEPGARTLANQESVDIRFYDIIYNLIDDIEKALQGLLTPVVTDVVEGYATVRAIFNLGKNVKAAGVYVNTGRISRSAEVHVVRDKQRLFAGSMLSLKHFKDDVRELNAGLEGGIVLDGFQGYREGDILEAHLSVQPDS